MKPQSSIGDLKNRVISGEKQRYDLAPGQTLGDYRVLRLLGRGGMGEVYLAENRVAGTRVALKVISGEATGPGFLERFRVESRVMSGLRHPNIVQVHHAGESEGRYYLTMDFIAGPDGQPRTLADELEEAGGKGLAVERVRELMEQLLSGLSLAHAKGVVHRDLKPANLLLDAEGKLHIADFGLAKVVGEDFVSAMVKKSISLSMGRSIGEMPTRPGSSKRAAYEGTSTGAILGTYDYMSPEQKAGAEVTKQSDIYALGVILYRMLTGRKPEGRAKAVSHYGVSLEWDAIVDKCLEPDFQDRYADVGEIKAALEGLGLGGKGSHGGTGARSGSGRISRKGAKTRSGKGVWGRVALWGLVLGVLGVGGWWGWGELERRAEMRAAERAQAELAARQSAETRAEVNRLRGEIEAALAVSDLERAGRLLTELAGLDAGAAAPLRARYESQAGARETNARYATASLAHERAKGVDPGQGLGARLEGMERAWREGEVSRGSGAWGQALSAYDQVIALSGEILARDEARHAVTAPREAAERARAEAQSAGAGRDAKVLWDGAEALVAEAAELFGKGDFEASGEKWREARTAYGNARTRAVQVQAYARAKVAYEQALGRNQDLLQTHGGTEWREVLRLVRLGEASANDPEEGRRAYEQALEGLPGAVTEAEARERAGRLATALGQARSAKAEGNWERVLAAAGDALGIESGNEEARTLKREAEGNLVPILVVAATVGGREVPATLSMGGQTYTLPQRLTLRENVRYEGTVSYETDGKRYTADPLSLVADWKGERRRELALTEIRGPVEGQNWRSPETGMEFVWIPAMGMWVGKYEVTNEEYRRMVPGHNSGEYGRHSLNRDRQPVVRVNFDDAKAYAAWMTGRDREAGLLPAGYRYRLPTEQEWETFAKAGRNVDYPWGNQWPPPSGRAGNYHGQEGAGSWAKIQNYNDGHPVTAPVEEVWANPWGLHGVGGNVWEATARDAANSSFGAWRGGSWDGDLQDVLRVSFRFDVGGSPRDSNRGFRLVLSR
jgi:hypothetical protein